MLKKGSRFDAEDWARKSQWVTKGSLTFLEAYERTGRILNISVIPYDPHSPPKLLNYLTTPDCVVWSAGEDPCVSFPDPVNQGHPLNMED